MEAAAIATLADAAGFRYTYDAAKNEFAHATGIVVVTPQGKTSRYYYGIEFSPRDLRLGLIEAAAGKIGSPIDQLLLFCYHYDPLTGQYNLIVTRVLRLAGVATAHHSFTATYFEDRTTEIQGKLLQFMFRNPHSFVHVEAPDENGTMQRWAVEWGGAGQLSGQGVTNQTLRVGDIVSITGNPGRDPADHRIRMQYLRRPADGFEWGRNPGETFN